MKHSMKRKGFTLVELLIVIVVIGILSAMMMMSSTEAVTSAKTSNIISNLRNLKTAALACYTDSMDYFTANPTIGLYDSQQYIRRYLSGKNTGEGDNANPEIANYFVVNSNANDNTWWVVYQIQGSKSEVASIKSKLKGRAKSLGLVGSAKGPTKDKDAALDQGLTDKDKFYDGEEFVALLVR